jgi:hypothetical protein
MTDYGKLLETIYDNVNKLHKLIKDHEQDLRIVDKAAALMEDTKSDLLYLNDCIYRYVSDVQPTDQNADSTFSDTTGSPNVSTSSRECGNKHNQQQSTKQSPSTDDSDDEIL